MSRNNTGNPIDSMAFPDFQDNVKNLDQAVNSEELSWRDRFGRDRKSFEGMEREFDSDQAHRENEFDSAQAYRNNAFESAQTYRESRFNDFIASSGYQFVGDYGPGIEITEYNQLVRDENGEFWRLSGQVELPYTTTGAGIPEDDALVPAGDAVLRQDLASPGKGAEMIAFIQAATDAVERTLADKVRERVSVTDFMTKAEISAARSRAGQLDMTDNISKAFLFAISTGCQLYFPSGTYTVRKLAFDLTIGDGQFLCVSGDGRASIIKYLDGTVNARFDRMFILRVAADANAEGYFFRDLYIDMNARGQGFNSGTLDFEQCHAFNVLSPLSTSVRWVSFTNVGINDPIADGFNNASGANCVHNYIVYNCYAENRKMLRRDIQWSTPPKIGIISGFRGLGIETEHGATGVTAEGSDLYIFDSIVETLDVAGHQNTEYPAYFRVHLEGLHVIPTGELPADISAGAPGTLVGACVLSAKSCTLHMGAFSELVRLRRGSVISDCLFLHEVDIDTGQVTALNVRDIESEYSSDTVFDSCRFVINTQEAFTPAEESCLVYDQTVKTGALYQKTFKNCWFDSRAEYSIQLNRNGVWRLIDCDLGGTVAAARATSGSGFQTKLEMHGGIFSRTPHAINYSGVVEFELVMTGDHRGQGAAGQIRRSGSAALVTLINSRRIVDRESPPAQGWRGDRIISAAPVNVTEWVCLASSDSVAQYARSSGVSRQGNTASRPALTTQDAGQMHFDTSLASAGKPIYWTGTQWVDATGAPV